MWENRSVQVSQKHRSTVDERGTYALHSRNKELRLVVLSRTRSAPAGVSPQRPACNRPDERLQPECSIRIRIHVRNWSKPWDHSGTELGKVLTLADVAQQLRCSLITFISV